MQASLGNAASGTADSREGLVCLSLFFNIKFKYHCITLIFLFQHHMCRLAAGRDPPRIGAARSVCASGRSIHILRACGDTTAASHPPARAAAPAPFARALIASFLTAAKRPPSRSQALGGLVPPDTKTLCVRMC